jgi:hypothetical protein
VADRSSFALRYGTQTAFGTPKTTGLKPLRLSQFDPQANFATVEDDSILPGTRLGGVGRAGAITLTPRITANFGSDEFDVLLALLFQGAWATNVLSQGSAKTWLTLEDYQSDAASAIVYQDCIPNTCRVRVSPNALIPIEFGMLATRLTSSGTATASPVAAGTDDSFDSFSGTLLYGGAAFDMTSLEFTLDNRGESRTTLFSRYANRIVFAPDRVTGQFTCQYTGPARLADTLAGTNNAISVQFNGRDSTGNPKSHTWLFPTTVNLGWSAPVSTDPERIQTISFDAKVNAGSKVTVTRA